MALISCLECKADVSTDAGRCPSCGAKVPTKAEYDKRVRDGYTFLFKFVAVVLVAYGVYSFYDGVLKPFFNGDRKKVVVSGQSVTRGQCRSDIANLKRLERKSPDALPTARDLIRTDLSDAKVGPCGALALAQLESYIRLRDDVTNLRTTMSSVYSSSQIDEVTTPNRRASDEAKSAYSSELEKLELLLK